MSNLYRGPSIDASYQVSLHLAEGFQRRRLKCEKDDRRRTTDAKWWQKLTLPLARWAKKGSNSMPQAPVKRTAQGPSQPKLVKFCTLVSEKIQMRKAYDLRQTDDERKVMIQNRMTFREMIYKTWNWLQRCCKQILTELIVTEGWWDRQRRGRYRTVVGFTTTYAITALWVRMLRMAMCTR